MIKVYEVIHYDDCEIEVKTKLFNTKNAAMAEMNGSIIKSLYTNADYKPEIIEIDRDGDDDIEYCSFRIGDTTYCVELVTHLLNLEEV